ncbi:MAG: hypothetical protein ACLP9C_06270 [Acidimicrobiales bacterium]
MPGIGEHPNPEDRISELKTSIGKYISGAEEPTGEALAELARAVHELADHVVDLHKRFERVEASLPEWTTQGWIPSPGNSAEDR